MEGVGRACDVSTGLAVAVGSVDVLSGPVCLRAVPKPCQDGVSANEKSFSAHQSISLQSSSLMPVTNLEERTVEVLALPEYVDDELLSLYFENKRRSGGGSLLSLERKGDRAILVFEDTEAAAQVLSKAQHVLHNVELTVRKPPSKDHSRLLLSGIKPDTNTELIELYVENMMELNVTDYTLYPSPGREFILIHLSKPLSKDFQELNAKVSKRTLDGAMVRLEEIEQTDSVLVENLHPGTTPDILTLYFESKRGGDQKVKDVKMLSEGTAKVSFVNFDSLGPVLDHQHSLDGADLVVKAYFDFLQPTDNETSQNLRSASQDVTESNSEDLSDIQMQTSPPMMVTASSPSSSQPLAADDVVVKEADEVMENQIEDEDKLSSHIVIADPVKLALLQLSPLTQNIKKDHPHFTIQIKDDGVHIQGPGRQKLEQIQRTIADMVANMAETDFAIERENAQFLARNDVKEHLVQIMKQTGLPTLYSVSDSKVLVTSLSQNLAQQACKFLKSQPCHVNIPLDVQYECMLYCREWSEFLQALSFCTVKVSERERTMDVLTLKGMENEKETVILQFLTTPIERETVIPMEPGVLKYIQTYCHHLLADMDQVYIFPLEAEDVTGLKIHGHAVACQMAEEVLQGIVSSICTKTITVNAPGVSRFLGLPECKDILDEMERKFQVYINPKQGPWEPLPHQDILKSAWTMLSHRNIQRVSVDDASPLLPSSALTNALLEEAKKIVSAIDEGLTESGSNSEQNDDMDNMDLYTAEEPTSIQDQDPDIILLDTPQVSAAGNTASGFDRGLPSDLEEEAQLSLAIQYSMESSQWPLDEEEEQLKKALELSMIQQEASSPSTDQSLPVGQLEKSPDASLQDAIKAANTIQLEVFASYSCDLIRVDIAFGKKVSQRQAEEKLEHRSVRNFSEYHMKCLELIKRKHAVEIKVQGTIITVSGFKDFVFGGMWDLKLFMEHITNPISREEILRTAQWVLHDPASSDITPYSPDATVFIENAWRMKLTKVDVLLDNQPHTINFEKMQEYNITSGNTVKISRKMLNSADLNEDIPEEEYSLLSNMPEATKVDEESDEFQNVVKDFYGTIQEYHSKIRIIQVEKLMNRLLYNQYKLKKASILQRATYPEIERTLYHGTSEASVKEICIHGFDRSFCGKNATVYGQGVYFAVNSALSIQDQYSPPNADGYKFVFVSKVLTGDFTKGCHSMKTAPLKETGDIPLRYDSVTDDITKPSMFVIFNDTQAFPEYLITCQRIHS
ncbi:protein mono-ADP-ribosyltransferase PARP10 isoform X2 [Echeneis naucrates]|uniref:protein mono-ADP-ribosyltransferase PARP10 isoform X2 n=1 Tax=Echeneis naucrates TaxID=173247 RepID=UPI001113D221|nr:protein mono-ADP-ribosyltransferase PARP10 isoform X2 [Echeneis naucrates]